MCIYIYTYIYIYVYTNIYIMHIHTSIHVSLSLNVLSSRSPSSMSDPPAATPFIVAMAVVACGLSFAMKASLHRG